MRRTEGAPRVASVDDVPPGGRLLGQGARKFLGDKGGLFGLAVVLTLGIVALVGPHITPYDPFEISAERAVAPPSSEHIFGTDQLGRDVFSRIILGTQVSLSVALMSVFASLLVGVPLGLVAAVRGGPVDTVVSSLFDTVLAFPAVLLGIGLVSVLGSGIVNVAIAVAVINIPVVGRLTRSATHVQLAWEYVEAARAIGVSGFRIVVRHLLPNIVAPILVQATITMAGAILLEATFSFLGLGIRAPTPSWGSMLDGGRPFLATAPWLGIFPGLTISVTVLAFNSLGDAIQGALDPRRL